MSYRKQLENISEHVLASMNLWITMISIPKLLTNRKDLSESRDVTAPCNNVHISLCKFRVIFTFELLSSYQPSNQDIIQILFLLAA